MRSKRFLRPLLQFAGLLERTWCRWMGGCQCIETPSHFLLNYRCQSIPEKSNGSSGLSKIKPGGFLCWSICKEKSDRDDVRDLHENNQSCETAGGRPRTAKPAASAFNPGVAGSSVLQPLGPPHDHTPTIIESSDSDYSATETLPREISLTPNLPVNSFTHVMSQTTQTKRHLGSKRISQKRRPQHDEGSACNLT